MNKKLHSDLPIPPGEYLQEVLDELGMARVELSRAIGISQQAIDEIIAGTRALTLEIAVQLEKTVRVPARLWIGLEEEYRSWGKGD